MNHLELHIIQSVPVACLNRDDLNSPKTAMFGGVQRARVSSQAWKSPIREEMKEIEIALFKGNRSRRMVSELSTKLQKKGLEKDTSVIISEHVADIIETLDTKTDGDGFRKIKTLMFFSEAEYDAVVDAVTDETRVIAETVRDLTNAFSDASKALKETDDEKKDAVKKEMERLEREIEKTGKKLAKAFNDKKIRDAIKSVQLKDAADIALFGRMVANDHSLTVEAASMFSHALSTHKADNEIDFFAAVDDLQPSEEAGAGMTGTLEFNSATYYRFAALNLDMLADKDHLGAMTAEERQSIVRTFLEATIKAMPAARKYTMNGNTIPVYVLGIAREKGHPIQLVNAFENPVPSSKRGFVVESINRLNDEFADLKNNWGIDSKLAMAVVKGSLRKEIEAKLGSIETCGLNELIDGMVNHVI